MDISNFSNCALTSSPSTKSFVSQVIALCAVVVIAAQAEDSIAVAPNLPQDYGKCRARGNISMPPRNQAVALSNVAFGKPASQSSDYSSRRYHAGKAVNGVYSHDPDHMFAFSHTTLEANPWWQVDLEDNFLVDTIRVYNRYGCCPERLSGFKVTLLNEYKNTTRVLQGPTSTNDMGGYIEFNLLNENDPQNLLQDGQWCFPTRYVKIEVDDNYLTLREVQVFALDRSSPVDEDEGYSSAELHYGDDMQLFLQGNNPKVLSGGHGPEQALVRTQEPEEGMEAAETFRVQWNEGQGSRDREAAESTGKCVRYGDKVLLQSMAMDDRFLAFIWDFRQSTQTLPATKGRIDHRFWWTFRSNYEDATTSEGSLSAQDALAGECVRHGVAVYLQNEMYHWLRGGYKSEVHSQSRTIAIYGNVDKYQWKVNVLRPAINQEVSPVTGVAARWVEASLQSNPGGCNCERPPSSAIPYDVFAKYCNFMWEKYGYCIV